MDYAKELAELSRLNFEKLKEIEKATALIDRLEEKIKDIKRDCEICNWTCETCGVDYHMTETDLYLYVSEALEMVKEWKK